MTEESFAYPECEDCVYNSWDEDAGDSFCTAAVDEDDLARMSYRKSSRCHFYKGGDEYMIVRKQI